jgi:transcriptional regulator with XRE-family HTH domain
VRLQESVPVMTGTLAQIWYSVKPPASTGQMPPRKQQKPFDKRLAKQIGQRVRIILEKEGVSVTAFTERLGISRSWFHDILSGLVPPSLETMSVLTDNLGYSLDWLRTGKGMPSDRWSGETTLVRRLALKTSARQKISLERIEGELALVPTSFLAGFEADVADLGVLGGEKIDLGPLVGPSDEVLIDLKDHTLVKNGLFIAQVNERLVACRAIKAHSFWLLSSAESVTPESLIEDYRVLGRIRLVWKRF